MQGEVVAGMPKPEMEEEGGGGGEKKKKREARMRQAGLQTSKKEDAHERPSKKERGRGGLTCCWGQLGGLAWLPPGPVARSCRRRRRPNAPFWRGKQICTAPHKPLADLHGIHVVEGASKVSMNVIHTSLSDHSLCRRLVACSPNLGSQEAIS